MRGVCIALTLVIHSLLGVNFGCISCPTVGVSTVSPMTFATIRRDQHVPVRGTGARLAQWLVQGGVVNVWRIVLVRHGQHGYDMNGTVGLPLDSEQALVLAVSQQPLRSRSKFTSVAPGPGAALHEASSSQLK